MNCKANLQKRSLYFKIAAPVSKTKSSFTTVRRTPQPLQVKSGASKPEQGHVRALTACYAPGLLGVLRREKARGGQRRRATRTAALLCRSFGFKRKSLWELLLSKLAASLRYLYHPSRETTYAPRRVLVADP